MVLSLISVYSGREPRRAINLLDSFEPGSTVTVAELETFFNVYEGKQLVTLIDYLYTGDVLHGLEFIQDMDLGGTFQSSLLDVVRVAQNGESQLLNRDAILHIREIVDADGFERLLGFAIDCTTQPKLTRNVLSGYFLKWCSIADILLTKPEKQDDEKVHMQDIGLMHDMLEQKPEIHTHVGPEVTLSLEDLMAQGEVVE
jgi:hypothetical protein